MSGLSYNAGTSYDDGTSPAPVSNITIGASPFVYQNTGPNSINVIVQGGTVSLIEFSRDGTTFYNVGITAGIVPLSVNDRVRVTYTAAPTMTRVPR
jgi:hypothetical protein